MNEHLQRIASHLDRIAETLPPNPLDGKRNEAARKFIFKLADPHLHGIYSDEYWRGPTAIFKEFQKAGLDYDLMGAEYGQTPDYREMLKGPNPPGNPNNKKEWKIEFHFTNNNGKETTLNGLLTAFGAGSMDDVLEKYDLTFQVY